MEKIKCNGVSFTYPESEKKALDGVSFSLSRGELCLLTGPSAAGKSTLLRLLKKEIAPAGTLTGALTVNGTVGYLFQHTEESLVCDNVRSELSFGLTGKGMSGSEIELAVAEIASYFDIEKLLDKRISELSGGEKQLVCLAAVMVLRPDILVLDEPCSQLDPVASAHFLSLLLRLQRDYRLTVLLSEHSNEAVFDFADTILLLADGKMLVKDKKETAIARLLTAHRALSALLPVKYRMSDLTEHMPSAALPTETALQMKHIRFAYEKGRDVLKETDFTVYCGKINAVIGANGSGKSTLLKVMAGVCKGYRGSVRSGERIAMLTQQVKDVFTKERCGDEVTFGELTERLGLGGLQERHPYDLSGGQAQRLAIAKLLEKDASLLLLDEPTRGLDALLKQELGTLLRELCERGKTVVIASHDLEFVGDCCDAVSFLSDGRILAADTPERLFASLYFYTTPAARLTGGTAVSHPEEREE